MTPCVLRREAIRLSSSSLASEADRRTEAVVFVCLSDPTAESCLCHRSMLFSQCSILISPYCAILCQYSQSTFCSSMRAEDCFHCIFCSSNICSTLSSSILFALHDRCSCSLMFNSWSYNPRKVCFSSRTRSASAFGSGIWQCMLTSRPPWKCGSSGIREFQINNGYVRLFKQRLSNLSLTSMHKHI